jgi:hypothetical protein
MPKDGRADICSCNIRTSAIHGGRMTQGAMDGGAAMCLADGRRRYLRVVSQRASDYINNNEIVL